MASSARMRRAVFGQLFRPERRCGSVLSRKRSGFRKNLPVVEGRLEHARTFEARPDSVTPVPTPEMRAHRVLLVKAGEHCYEFGCSIRTVHRCLADVTAARLISSTSDSYDDVYQLLVSGRFIERSVKPTWIGCGVSRSRWSRTISLSTHPRPPSPLEACLRNGDAADEDRCQFAQG